MPNQKTPSSTDHIIQCPSFELPESPLLSQATYKAIQHYRNYTAKIIEQLGSQTEDEAALSEQERFYQGDIYKRLKAQYPVDIEEGVIGGILTETFVPFDGIAEKNKSSVLIHLHGGGFCSGSRTNSRLEAIPVAALGKIKVISVDYRMAPEYRFPAATDDVEAVYRELLKHYKPESIGMFGASSGAQLTAMTMVRLQEKNLPLPRAVGMIAGGTTRIIGDSVEYVGSMLKAAVGMDLKTIKRMYFDGADLTDPRVTPALSDTYMSAFPPSLLASSTRDYLLSSVVATHRQLTGLGVKAELHVWEGLDHVFHYNPNLPETKELNETIVQFFEKYLGTCP